MAAWGVLAAWLAPLVAAETANRIVAIVNDAVITEADLSDHLESLLEDPPADDPPAPQQLQRAALERLIQHQLILQEAKRLEVPVGGDDVLKRLDQLRSRYDSEEAFRQSLAESGISEERLKEQLREQLAVQRLIEAKIRATIAVSPQEVAKEIGLHPELAKPGDRVRVSHLLIRVHEARPEDKALALIQDLRRQVQAGKDFRALATRYSEDAHAADGGHMGWVAQGELLPELDRVLFTPPPGVAGGADRGAGFTLEPGMCSEPIQTRLGYHLITVEERRTASALSLTEAHQAVYQRLYQQKFETAFARWIAQLRRQAYIEVLLPTSS